MTIICPFPPNTQTLVITSWLFVLMTLTFVFCMWDHTIFVFSIQLISLSMMYSKLIHVVKNGFFFFLWLNNISLYIVSYLEKAMEPHSSTLAWKIPWMEQPGRLQSMESLRVGHNWATSLSLFTFMHWRRKWQPAPVLLPGESQGRGSLMGCRPWGRTESDTTEAT